MGVKAIWAEDWKTDEQNWWEAENERKRRYNGRPVERKRQLCGEIVTDKQAIREYDNDNMTDMKAKNQQKLPLSMADYNGQTKGSDETKL